MKKEQLEKLNAIVYHFLVPELQRRLDGVTQSSLTKSLRELERDGFLRRTVYQEIPPRVEYTLTEMGQSFAPILHSMLAWSEAHLPPERREDANI